MEGLRADRFRAVPTPPAPSAPAEGRRSLRGRPAATSHAAIEEAAFRLFSDRGFEATTLSDIAEEAGIGQRTLTRYYRSKNDIPWGQFDRTLEHFEQLLADSSPDLPLWERVHRAVVEFNRFPDDAEPPHRERMRLILRTPALQAHSVLQYAHWRDVIARFVAGETGVDPGDPVPQLVGHVSLALAMTAYEQWLDDTGLTHPHAESNARLLEVLERSMAELRTHLALR
jgi:mycofactocin system transcriptional regulator